MTENPALPELNERNNLVSQLESVPVSHTLRECFSMNFPGRLMGIEQIA
jgi:hypothetical protein